MEKSFSIIEDRNWLVICTTKRKGEENNAKINMLHVKWCSGLRRKTNQGKQLKSDKKKALVGCFSLFEQQAAMRGRVL